VVGSDEIADATRERGAAQAPHPENPATTVVAKVGQLSAGFRLLFEGFSLLRRERGLWPLAWVPLFFSLLTAGATMALLYANAGELYGLIDAGLPVLDVDAWYQWLWIGPARFVIWLSGYLLFVFAAALALVLSLMIATVAASPFLDALSQRVERLQAGERSEAGASGVAGLLLETGRSMLSEAQRLLFYVSIWAVCFALGLVIPGAHLVTGPLIVGITILFLPLDYAGYSLDRRQIPFRARASWLLGRLPTMVGFGSAALISCFIPGLNLVMIPVLVVSGTLLVLRHPPAT